MQSRGVVSNFRKACYLDSSVTLFEWAQLTQRMGLIEVKELC